MNDTNSVAIKVLEKEIETYRRKGSAIKLLIDDKENRPDLIEKRVLKLKAKSEDIHEENKKYAMSSMFFDGDGRDAVNDLGINESFELSQKFNILWDRMERLTTDIDLLYKEHEDALNAHYVLSLALLEIKRHIRID